MSCWSSRTFFTAAVMSLLQISVALLCLFSLTCAELDPRRVTQIAKNVKALEVDKEDLAKRYASSHDFTQVLDQGLKLVERMDDMVHEFGIEQEYPSVAEFVEDLKTFVENVKVFTTQQMDEMEEEYEEKENNIRALLMKFLEGTDRV